MKIHRIIDVTRKISTATTVWPGDDGVKIHTLMSLKEGKVCNLSSITMGLHTGTHIDAPTHFIDNNVTIDTLNLDRFIGFVKVFELDVDSAITEKHIKELDIHEGDVVFFKTSNSQIPMEGEFSKEYIYLDSSAALQLVERKIKTVGVDYLSVDGFHTSGFPAHHILLSHGIGIIESLYLEAVEAGSYFFSCLPLKVEGVEGAPARAVLLEFE